MRPRLMAHTPFDQQACISVLQYYVSAIKGLWHAYDMMNGGKSCWKIVHEKFSYIQLLFYKQVQSILCKS